MQNGQVVNLQTNRRNYALSLWTWKKEKEKEKK